MTTDLVPTTGSYTLAEIQNIGELFAKSGYFKDANDMAKAVTKILAGQEIGLGPMASMTGYHIIQGKPTLSATLIGGFIKRSGRYDYRIKTLDDTRCVICFYEHGRELHPLSEFTKKDAETAGLLSNPTWKSYPRNMLFSRALTNGARWHCPDVFGGAIYTPDEMGAVVDEAGEMVSVPEPPPPPPSPAPPPPLFASAERVQEILNLESALAEAGAFTHAQFTKALAKDYEASNVASLSPEQAEELFDRLTTKLAASVPTEESQYAIPEGARA